MDRETREIIGIYIGVRSEEGAKQLWNSLFPIYRQCAVCCTDFWATYACICPSKRHQPVGKDSGKTNHIERFNNTGRQRVSRSVRKTLSFSKKIENPIGAIWYFIHQYNYVLSE
jgi:IS1 family transposase